MKTITFRKTFAAPVEAVFPYFADHEAFGKVLGQNISRIKEGRDCKNGVGSVRLIKLPLGLSFEETVLEYRENSYISYRVSRGSPVKDHLGKMSFNKSQDGCFLHYEIKFSSRYPLPGLEAILAAAIKRDIGAGLTRLADQLQKQ